MKWIDYENAKTVDEAIKILSQSGGKARPMAGGTDLIVQLRVNAPRVDADVVVNVKEIPELNELIAQLKGSPSVQLFPVTKFIMMTKL